TGARASLAAGGAGRVRLGPTRASVEVTREGAAPTRTAVAIPEGSLDLTPERLTLALEALEIAALSASAVRVAAIRTPEGKVDHVDHATVTRLEVKAADVEA